MKITASIRDCNSVAKGGVSVYASEVLDCWCKYNGMVITGYRYNKDQTFFYTECFYYPGSIPLVFSCEEY